MERGVKYMKLNERMNIKSTIEIERPKAHITVEIIEYLSNSIVCKTIINKSTGGISVMSFDTGEELPVKTTPFDTFAQIIDGTAEIMIAGETFFLEAGQSIVIPAYAPNYTRPNGRFKMILTVIKNGID